ncbi:MAG: hypothetical protein HOG49_08250 [Candidatus Scalindua sp.]|jgi:hypothetical protein|nr:hypothetical protein [Candidatus Scalindua sp.]
MDKNNRIEATRDALLSQMDSFTIRTAIPIALIEREDGSCEIKTVADKAYSSLLLASTPILKGADGETRSAKMFRDLQSKLEEFSLLFEISKRYIKMRSDSDIDPYECQ